MFGVPSENEISSTEKLLNVIRRNDGKTDDLLPEKAPAGNGRRAGRKWLPSRAKTYVGVEILRDSVNVVQTRRRRGTWEVLAAAPAPLPAGMTPESPEFPEFLKARMQQLHDPRSSEIWACLPPAKGEIWNVRAPRVKRGLSNAVYWSARREKAFAETECVFDYRITGETAEDRAPKLLAQACTAPAADIAGYRRMFSEIGYPLSGITLPAFALENLFSSKWIDPGQDTWAVVYIGDEASCIDIHSRDAILFSRVVKTGKESILDALGRNYTKAAVGEEAIEMEVPRQQGPEEDRPALGREESVRVLDQLRRAGSGQKTPGALPGISGERVFEMILPALERLARQLERTIDHCVHSLHNPAPACVYIFGEVTFIAGLADFFGEQLGIAAEVPDLPAPDPTRATGGVLNPEPVLAPGLSCAAGLAMPSPKTINFLRTALDRDEEKKALRGTNFVAAACALLFVITAGYWGMSRHEIKELRAENHRLEKRLAQYTPRLQMADLDRLVEQIGAAGKELARFSNRLRPVAVLKEINRLTPPTVGLLSLKMETAPPGAESGRNRENAIRIEGFITGQTMNAEAHLASYLLRLRRSPLFETADIRGAAREKLHPASDTEAYKFTIRIVLKEARHAPVA